MIDPKIRHLQEIMGFLLKIQLYLKLYALIMTVKIHQKYKIHQNV